MSHTFLGRLTFLASARLSLGHLMHRYGLMGRSNEKEADIMAQVPMTAKNIFRCENARDVQKKKTRG